MFEPKRKKPQRKEPFGRPTLYSLERAQKICEIVSTHPYGLKKLRSMYPDIFPEETSVYLWRIVHEDFSKMYALAKANQADILAEECLNIADDDSKDIRYGKDGEELLNAEFVQRSRVRIDTRKWLASKLLPKMYGDRKEVEQLQDENARVKEELAELRAKLDEKNKSEY